MQGESLPERLARIAGSDVSPALRDFDPADPLQVDDAARVLLSRLSGESAGEAFTLLTELTVKHVSDLACDVARQVGLVMDTDDLVATFYSRLLVDLRPRVEVHHFLKLAHDWLREEAEAWVRDYACTELPRPDGARAADTYDEVVRVCFHRLDLPARRLLRAAEVEGLDNGAIARTFSITPEEAADQLGRARMRLAEAIEDALEGGHP